MNENDECHVYLSSHYYKELNTARLLHDLNLRGTEPVEEIRKKIESDLRGRTYRDG